MPTIYRGCCSGEIEEAKQPHIVDTTYSCSPRLAIHIEGLGKSTLKAAIEKSAPIATILPRPYRRQLQESPISVF